MKMTSIVALVGIVLCASTNSNAVEQPVFSQVKNYESSGNLEPTNKIGCVATEKLSNKFTPVDLYKSVSVCIDQGKYKEGAIIFALAGVYGRYDTLRVSDKTAHQAVSVLMMQQLGNMPLDQQSKLQTSLTETLGNPTNLDAVCKKFVRVGPPEYVPRYMIQHGMGAFTRSQQDNGLVANFNASAAWKQSLDGYLHCKDL